MNIRKYYFDSTNRLFAKYLENHNKYLKKFHSKDCKILISGNPRGGTTWLLEMIGEIENSCTLWEPLRPYRLYEDNLKEFSDELGWFPYIPPDKNWPEGLTFFKNLLNGQHLNYKSILRHNSYRNSLRAKYLIIKCVTANMMIPWIHENSDIKIIYILRHPCAVVNSQLKFPVFTDESYNEYLNLKNNKFNHLYDDFRNIFDSLKSDHEKLAAIWSVSNLVPLNYIESGNRKKIKLVYYEDLIVNPKKELNEIFHFMDQPIPDGIYDRVNIPSKTTIDGSPVLKGGNQLESWKTKLTKAQQNQVIEVINKFNIYNYSLDKMPCKIKRFEKN